MQDYQHAVLCFDTRLFIGHITCWSESRTRTAASTHVCIPSLHVCDNFSMHFALHQISMSHGAKRSAV